MPRAHATVDGFVAEYNHQRPHQDRRRLDPLQIQPDSVAALPAALAELPDSRARRGVQHRLTVVVTAAVSGVIAGYRSYTAIGE